jgi:hypothetical protein
MSTTAEHPTRFSIYNVDSWPYMTWPILSSPLSFPNQAKRNRLLPEEKKGRDHHQTVRVSLPRFRLVKTGRLYRVEIVPRPRPVYAPLLERAFGMLWVSLCSAAVPSYMSVPRVRLSCKLRSKADTSDGRGVPDRGTAMALINSVFRRKVGHRTTVVDQRDVALLRYSLAARPTTS